MSETDQYIWAGPAGVTPGLGLVAPGDIIPAARVPARQRERLLRRGHLQPAPAQGDADADTARPGGRRNRKGGAA